MNKKMMSSMLGLGFILVSLFLLAACQPVAAEELSALSLDAGDVQAFRWEATARGYERLGLLNNRMDAGDVKAVRWEAIGRGYERLGLLNNRMDAGDVKAFRWEAVARGYERLGLLNN